MNNVNLIGRITADPDVKNSSSGKPLCHFTLAVDRAFKRDGQPDADFIRCIAFDKTADIMDPDVKNSSSGKPLCHFTLAVDRAFKRDGQPDADFIRCIAFDKTADIMSRYVHKGDRLGVSGSIQTGSYTDNG